MEKAEIYQNFQAHLYPLHMQEEKHYSGQLRTQKWTAD